MHEEVKKCYDFSIKKIKEKKEWQEILESLSLKGTKSFVVFTMLVQQFYFSRDNAESIIKDSGLWVNENSSLVDDFFDSMIYWDSEGHSGDE